MRFIFKHLILDFSEDEVSWPTIAREFASAVVIFVAAMVVVVTLFALAPDSLQIALSVPR